MSARKEISALMAAALAMASEHNGELVRYVGGYWSFRGCPKNSTGGSPVEYFGTSTIEGLVARKRLEYSEWRDGRAGKFPVAAKIVQEAP